MTRQLEMLYQKIDSAHDYVHFVHKKVHELDKKVTEVENAQTPSVTSLFKAVIPKFLVPFIYILIIARQHHHSNPLPIISNQKLHFVPWIM